MSLLNFDAEMKEKLEANNVKKMVDFKDRLKKEGKSEYDIDRQVETLTLTPDKLTVFEPTDINLLQEVTFYFTTEEYNKFADVFKILTYQGNNSTQNWLITGIIKLIKEGRIQYSESRKEVWVI